MTQPATTQRRNVGKSSIYGSGKAVFNLSNKKSNIAVTENLLVGLTVPVTCELSTVIKQASISTSIP